MIDYTLVAVAGASASVGGVFAVISARIAAGAPKSAALTEQFKALIDRQETERKALIDEFDWRALEAAKREEKLDRVASDLEAMVIRLIEWADEVTIIASRRGVELPPRPKFTHAK